MSVVHSRLRDGIILAYLMHVLLLIDISGELLTDTSKKAPAPGNYGNQSK